MHLYKFVVEKGVGVCRHQTAFVTDLLIAAACGDGCQNIALSMAFKQ